jgi:hypothetical protein
MLVHDLDRPAWLRDIGDDLDLRMPLFYRPEEMRIVALVDRTVNAGVKMSFFWRFENAESNGAPG